MSDDLFHCICRTCPAEEIAKDVATRAQFFEAHSDHEVMTETLKVGWQRNEPEGRVVLSQASD